jgi:hypothetical protein
LIETAVSIWILIGFAALIMLIWLMKWKPARISRGSEFGEPGEQLEMDMRLPYKRFKQLYPETEITYEEYKRMQKERSFRRALSSQENKRMVR